MTNQKKSRRRKVSDSKNIFYASFNVADILELQLDYSAEEIGYYLIFKAAYIYHKGKIPINKLCQFCRVFNDQENFIKFVQKTFKKRNNYYYDSDIQSEINLILEKSDKAKKSVASRGNKRGCTNVQTNDETDDVTNNNINININNNIKNKEKGGMGEKERNFEEFWQFYTPIKTKDGKVVAQGSKKKAKDCYLKVLKEFSHDQIMSGLKAYLEYCRTNNQLTCAATTFLNQERFNQEYCDNSVVVESINQTKRNIRL